MDLRLAGKRALITGASKGIGLAAAFSLGKEGCEVVIAARDGDVLDRAVQELRFAGITADGIACDLSREADQDALVTQCGAVDILVNNAGAIPPGSLQEIDMQRWRSAWDLKVFGYFALTQKLYKKLAERQGVIINVIGAGGERFPPEYIAGSAGNAALMGFVKAMGRASFHDGVRVVGINPGFVQTDRVKMMMQARAERELGSADRWEELFSHLPFGRAAKAEEIGDAVAFLASPLSGYTSGTILTIDGGYV
ncbi:short-chain dehydrogenase/reductase [Sphingobium sp. LMC3-1-1.1]|jgi:NAD(P)-dependent dehydrogenase (short-subunit alcohol dehydrogenase family)|uniref:short-chain dehydrogenase/reductase n=1 Tax=unclassified Sphingobium TaxID=2611147 RepID=UPI003436DD0F